jgi:hypothetical protein
MVLSKLGCRKIKTRGDEVWSTCPNESNHYDGTDNNPSFSARIETGDTSPCFCFSCDMSDVLEHVATVRGIPGFSKGIGTEIANPDDYIALPGNNRGVFSREAPEIMFPPEKALQAFDRALHRSLFDRGFTTETAKAWELRIDNQHARAMFVIRDHKGRLRGVSGRATRPGQKPKYLHYSWDTKYKRFWPWKEKDRKDDFMPFEKSLVLYGEHMVSWEGVPDNRKMLVLVEGQTDVLWCYQTGWRAVAPLGSAISIKQVDTAIGLVPRGGGLIIGTDADAAGRKLERKAKEMVRGRVPLYGVEFPEGKDPADIKSPLLDEIFLGARLLDLT